MALIRFSFMIIFLAHFSGPFMTGLSYAADLMSDNENKNPASVPVPSKSLIGVSTDASYFTRYIWHGLDYSGEKPVLQPEMILSVKKLSAIVWLNYDFETFNATNEYDLTMQYGDKWGPAGLILGYSYFTYPNRGWPDSEEVWIQGSYDVVLNPTVSLHDDFRSENGWYSSFGISHNIPLPLGTVTPAALLYYHAHCYGGTGFPSAEFDLADTITYRQMSTSAKITYFRALHDGDFKEMADQIVYSFNVAWSLP